MANVMKPEKRVRLLNLLVEGNSVRGTARLMDTNIRTVLRHLTLAGEECRMFLHNHLRDLKLRHVQIDEIWTFCKKKERRLKPEEKNDPGLGDQYLFIGFDEDTKLIASYALGKRTQETTERFMDDLSRRIVVPNVAEVEGGATRIQLSTDGFPAYPEAIANCFGHQVAYGQLIKHYGKNADEARYAPPGIVSAERIPMWEIESKATICTSHVERNNLTIRTFMKRFTRLSLGFSKKVPNLRAAIALHVFHYNFCRRHGSLRVTPAMAAGVVNELWSLGDLFG